MADILFDDLGDGQDIIFDDLDTLGAIGDGVTVSAAAPSGVAGVSAAASGAGVTDAATAPEGTAAVAIFAEGAGATAAAAAPSASAIGYATVTLAAPLYEGPGGVLFRFEGTPVPGDTVRYETRNGFTVLPSGECVADVNSGDYSCFYNDGSGEVAFTVTLTDDVQAWGPGATATASAPAAELYGGVNVEGTGADATAQAPTGSATVGIIAQGPGATAAATAPEATVEAGAQASGAGPSATATAPDAIAETVTEAQGAGVEVAAAAPQATASGDVQAIGAGPSAIATAPTAVARGDRVAGDIPWRFLVRVPRDDTRRRVA